MNQKLLDYVEYELASSWWAGHVTWGWLQAKIANHYIRKAERKFGNLQKFLHIRKLMKNGATHGHCVWAIMNRTWEKP